MDGIYGDYRGTEYLRVRQRWEPWYTEQWNQAASDDPVIAVRRCDSLREFLNRALDVSAIETVVDVGGDRGQFIPLGEVRLVVDLSRRELVEGVGRVASVANVENIDLLISAHVLEHLTDPAGELAHYSRAKYVYLEVPFGVPQLSIERALLTASTRALVHSPKQWARVTAPASGRSGQWARQSLRQSEHVNFFTWEGINRLLSRAGRAVVSMERGVMPAPDGYDVEVLRVLAT